MPARFKTAAALAASAGVLLAFATAAEASTLPANLTSQLRAAGGHGSGLAVDLSSGRTIWSSGADAAHTPASVTKLFTTTALLRTLGPRSRFTTVALAEATPSAEGIVHGNIWLRGSGDPSLTDAGIASVAHQIRAAGAKSITGSVLGDDSLFDRIRGLPSEGPGIDWDLGGPLGGLVYDHQGSARAAAVALTTALRHRGVKVPKGHVGVGATPSLATSLASVKSPRLTDLVAAMNAPSDNFYAETLLKTLGALKGTGGSTSAGLAVERGVLSKLGLHPTLHDGSGLSHSNRTTPREVESLLGHMNSNRSFTGSLAVAGRTGTLADRMRKGAAAGRCFGKTGTLIKVTALVGYCPVPEGGRVAFAIMMDGTTPEKGRPRQDRIVQALARWHRPAGWR